MSTQTSIAVREYLARVRTALADLPDSEVEEILEDVRPHLAEISEELGEGARIGAMVERLGTPESYAAELRAAGGYPARAEAESTKPRRRAAARLALLSLAACVAGAAMVGGYLGLRLRDDILVSLVLILPVLAAGAWYVWHGGAEQVADLPEVRRLRSALARESRVLDYLRSLQPAWWLVCAVVLPVLGIFLLLKSSGALLALPFLLAIGAAALWAGPRIRTDRRWLWLALPVSAFVLAGSVGLVGYAANRVSYSGSPASSYYGYQTADGTPNLMYGTEPVENLYLFDAQGKPLTDVYVFDQDGRPITLPRYACEPRTGGKSKQGTDNRFPRPHLEQGTVDGYGNRNGYNGYRGYCQQTEGVPFAAAIPSEVKPAR